MEINVEQIMTQIRKDIADKGYKAEDLKFVDVVAEQTGQTGTHYSEAEAEKALDYLSFHTANPVYFPLAGNPIKVFFQKVIRRLLFFLLQPAFHFQNVFNTQNAKFLNQTMNYMRENAKLQEQIKAQQEQIDALKQAVEALSNK